MSTRLFQLLAAPIIGKFGAAILRAAVSESDRADTAELNETRAKGERDEARMLRREEADRANTMLAQCEANAQQIADLYRETETLRSEVESGRVADDCAMHDRETIVNIRRELGIDDDVSIHTGIDRLTVRWRQLEQERFELQRRCRELAGRLVDSESLVLALTSETTNAARVIGELKDRCEAMDRQRHEHICPPVPSE